jgi:hypothetical protein
MLHNKFKVKKGLTTAEVNRARENTVRTKLPIKKNMAYFRLSRSYDHFIIGGINHLFHSGKTSDGIF